VVTDYPLVIRSAEGHLTEVLYNASVYKDASAQVLGVFAAARNVTALRQASEYVRPLIEASLDPLVTISADGKITDVNEAAVKITSVPRARLSGTDFSNCFTEPDKARLGYEQVFAKGSITDYSLAIRSAEGGPRDVTIRRRAELARNRALRALRMLNVCNTPIIHATDEHQLLADTCQAIVEIEAYRLAWVGYAQDDAANTVQAAADRGYRSALGLPLKLDARRAEVGATSGDDETICYVRDHGIGFDMQCADKLFGGFQRLHGTELPRTGIGQAIIKRLVGRHGRRVWAEGKVGQSACFFFTLPNRENADGGE